MRNLDSALGKAMALSLLLHALLLVAGGRPLDPPRGSVISPAAQLDVTLRSRAALAELEPTPLTDTPRAGTTQTARNSSIDFAYAVKPGPGPAAAKSGAATPTEAWQSQIRISRELLYPPEAIAQGLEGDALVLLVLDEAGDALAARLESSSGHLILDAAAVRAVGTLRGLPESVPREVVLPVRFRLR
jgi:protein TonB